MRNDAVYHTEAFFQMYAIRPAGYEDYALTCVDQKVTANWNKDRSYRRYSSGYYWLGLNILL